MALVLVVDDEPDIRELIQMNLELAGHRVLTAANGKEALESVQQELPDAILLDLMMPGVDGWQVLDQLKSRSGRDLSEIPVFMVTARTEPQNRLRGGIEGALRYITKPFDPAKLVEMLADALAPGAPPEPQQRRQVQESALEEVARRETAGGGEPATTPGPRVRLTRLEHAPTSSSPSPRLRNARHKLTELSAKQRQLLEALATRTPVTGVAQQLGMSRSNVYASLRRISRKLGLKGTNELLALVRQGALLGPAAGPGVGGARS
jgi:CheY-like chemotaxis protein/DNA-binding CsgD family transcriptional regulator